MQLNEVVFLSGALTSTYTLTVTVSDVNDYNPSCSSSLYSTNLAEDATIGSTVYQLTCTDADSEAPNNDISTYAITGGNTGVLCNIKFEKLDKKLYRLLTRCAA